MNICLFGGTFDPVHKGHIAIALTAADRFDLKRVLFCPASLSPFKVQQTSASYAHRFAMLALATQCDPRFILSDLESPEISGNDTPNYTIDTVRRLRRQLGKSDRLFFLCGIDAFAGIARWREPEALLATAEFIIAARPAHPLANIAAALPESMRPSKAVLKASRNLDTGSLVLRGATLHVLTGTAETANSTAIRTALENKRGIARYLDPAVAEYAKRNHLYSPSKAPAPQSKATVINFKKDARNRPARAQTRKTKRNRTSE